MNRLRAALCVLRGKSVIYGGKQHIKISTAVCSIDDVDVIHGVDIHVGSNRMIMEQVKEQRAEETARIAEAIAHGETRLRRTGFTYIGDIDPERVEIGRGGYFIRDKDR